MTENQRRAMQAALGCLVRAEAVHGQPNQDVQDALRVALNEPEQGPVTDEENERFSQDVSDFSGADPEATKYALEEFLRNRAKAQQPSPARYSVDIDQIASERYKVIPSHDDKFHRWAVVAGDGSQQLYLGREAKCQNMARKFTGAFLDGAYLAQQTRKAVKLTGEEIEAEWVKALGTLYGYGNFARAIESAVLTKNELTE